MNVEQKMQIIEAMRESQNRNAYRLGCPEMIEEEFSEDKSFYSTLGLRIFLSLFILGIAIYLRYSNQSFGGIGFAQLYQGIRQNWNISSYLQSMNLTFL